MSELKLSLPRMFDDGSPLLELVANIYPVDERARTALPHGKRNVVIEAGDYDHVNTLDLPPGRYLVEATMPTGDVLEQEVELHLGETTDVRLSGASSPHEWLGWQHLIGNVGSREDDPDGEGWMAQASVRGAAPRLEAAGGVTGRRAPRQVRWLVVPVGAGAAPAPQPGAVLRPTFEDGAIATVRVRSDTGEQAIEQGQNRGFLLVGEPPNQVLVSAPVPWWDIRAPGRPEVEFELLLSGTSGAVTSMVRDPGVGTMLGYMANGAPSHALRVTEGAEEMLFYKIANPLAAAAGGYLLLETEQDGAQKNWHQWIWNLNDWFPWMPDAAILLATLKLRHQKSPADVGEALELLVEADRRGLPYYSRGVRLLLDGLTAFEADPDYSPERERIDPALERTRRRALSTNFRQLFTTLRLADL